MNIEIDQSALVGALALAMSVADKRASNPVLANVLLRADGDALVCCATDMMIALTETVPCKVDSPGALTIGARSFHGIMRTLPAVVIKINRLDNAWARVRAGRSEFKLLGMPEGDFPELPDPDDVRFTAMAVSDLDNLIEKTLFSVSTDEARLNLNGALLECEPDGSRTTMVSTDGHRLTKFSMPVEGPRMDRPVVIPRKGLEEIRRVLARGGDDCDVGFASGHLFVRSGQLTISVKASRTAFPPYDQVVPKTYQRRVEAGRLELIGVLRQAAVIAPEKTNTVRLSIDKGKLELHADNPERGAVSLELPVDYDGGPLAAGFNATYLIDALSAINAQRIYLDFQCELDPVVVRPAGRDDVETPDFLAVVMPMRI